MASETRYLYNDEDLSRFANQVKEIVVQSMAAREVITEAESDAFLNQYAVLVAKKGWLGTAIDKALNLKEANDKKIIIVSTD